MIAKKLTSTEATLTIQVAVTVGKLTTMKATLTMATTEAINAKMMAQKVMVRFLQFNRTLTAAIAIKIIPITIATVSKRITEKSTEDMMNSLIWVANEQKVKRIGLTKESHN